MVSQRILFGMVMRLTWSMANKAMNWCHECENCPSKPRLCRTEGQVRAVSETQSSIAKHRGDTFSWKSGVIDCCDVFRNLTFGLQILTLHKFRKLAKQASIANHGINSGNHHKRISCPRRRSVLQRLSRPLCCLLMCCSAGSAHSAFYYHSCSLWTWCTACITWPVCTRSGERQAS